MKRRDFLKRSAGMPFLLQEIIALSSMAVMQNALGAVGNSPIKNYINLWMNEGAERWWFDSILTPNGSSDEVGTAGIGVFNTFKNYSDFAMEYRTTNEKVNGKFYLPHLWESILADEMGNSVPMNSLASNFATIRGIHTGLTFDAHGHNVRAMQNPMGHTSIAGGVADTRTNSPVGAIISHHSNFASMKGITPSNVPSSAENLFQGMMLQHASNSNGNYGRAPSSFLGITKLDSIVEAFINDLKPSLPTRKNRALEALLDNRKSAVGMIQKGFNGIKSDYNIALVKYQQIISYVMMPPDERKLMGLEDNPLRGTNFRFARPIKKAFSNGRYGDKGMWQGFRYAKCNAMAASFAKAEVYLKYGISRCMQLNIANVDQVCDDGAFNIYQGDPAFFDMHNYGSVFRSTVMVRYYQWLAACLLHFKKQTAQMNGTASGKTVWDETLLQLSSEFNRSGPRGEFGNDPEGTDHNIYACSESFFGGAIKDGPIVVGNIYDKYSYHKRCLGDGAPVAELGAIADAKHIYSTVGELTGFEGSRNHRPMLKIEGSKVVANVEPPKNIKNS